MNRRLPKFAGGVPGGICASSFPTAWDLRQANGLVRFAANSGGLVALSPPVFAD